MLNYYPHFQVPPQPLLLVRGLADWISNYCSVLQIRPPFCNLSLSTKRRGGLYAGCDNFSRDYALPSDKA